MKAGAGRGRKLADVNKAGSQGLTEVMIQQRREGDWELSCPGAGREAFLGRKGLQAVGRPGGKG